jgi:hypothetical protein
MQFITLIQQAITKNNISGLSIDQSDNLPSRVENDDYAQHTRNFSSR